MLPSNRTSSCYSARALVPLVMMGVVWAAIGVRLWQIYWHFGGSFVDRGTRQRSFEEVIPARPGDIVDREGRLLATTVTRYSVFVNPSRIDQPWETAEQLAAAGGVNADDLFRRIAANRRKQFLWVKRRIGNKDRERILQLGLPRDVLGMRPEYQRLYPMGSLAAHVLGIRGIDGDGRGGVEQACDELLRGEAGKRILMRDASGRVLDVREGDGRRPRHGRTVRLTLDSVVQLQAERELDRLMAERVPQSACVVVMDPRSADVLAMASRPAYDPNDPRPEDPAAWKNLAVASMYEPGSTFKPFVVAWALQQGVITRDDVFDCESGSYRMGRRILHDHHPYGELSVTDILVKSSNIGMAKIGERLGNDGLHEAAQVFGFGRRTGIGLPGEVEGMLRPVKEWTTYSTGSIPMGQELAVTPIQIITACAALANGGRWRSPHVIAGEVDDSRATPRFDATRVVAETVSADVAEWLIQGPLVQVVERGTGREAQIEGYRVFGKTGTAQKTDPETGEISSGRYVSSFLCGAPAANPRVLVLVVVDEPSEGGSYYGGQVAAPYAAAILKETLRLMEVTPAPDKIARGQ